MTRKFWLRLLAASLGLAVLAWTISKLGPREILAVALEANAWWLAASILPIVLRYYVWSWKWCRMLARDRAVPWRAATRLLMAGGFINLTTPTAKLGGGVLRAAMLKKHYGYDLPPAFGWVLADQLTNVMGSMLLFGVLAMAGVGVAPEGVAWAFLYSGGGALLLFVAMLSLRGWAWRAANRGTLARWVSRLTPARFRQSSHKDGDWVVPLLQPLLRKATIGDLLLSSGSFASLCVSNAFVLRSLGVDAPVWIVAVAVAIGYFAGNGLGPWGGVGVTEAAMAAVYLKLGVPGDAAAAGVLLHRAGYYLVGLGWGGVALARIGRRAAIEAARQ
jgi:uncharacterized membrane protein YbhN (UPF0104 family)